MCHNKKIKILVLHSWNGTYHVFRPVVEMFLELSKMNVELHFAGDFIDPVMQNFKNKGFRTYDINFRSKYDKESMGLLKDVLLKENFDIVHAIHNKCLANAIRVLKKSSIKLVAYRGATINWTDPTNYLTFLNPRVDAIICVCKTIEKNVKQNLKFWKTKTYQIYKGQELSWFQSVEKANIQELLGIPKNSFVVVLASSVRRVKGVEFFLKSTHYIPENVPIYFVCAGQGTDGAKMQKLKRESPLESRIHLLGHREDVLSIVKSSDCFVLPTIGTEGLSRSVIEAMLLKTAVISTKCGGPEELITNNKTGLLVEKKNPKAIAEAILKLYQQPSLRNGLECNAQNNIVENFNVAQSAQNVYDLYCQLTS